ncbi:MAG TPA: UDP-N-acetylmuramate dehydrogenase [Puia sp.]|nr:UDP-N-acetylmuramate dehydrogenase [Puia sp.]
MVQARARLATYNTFRVDVTADFFSAFRNVEELLELLSKYCDTNRLILGGGSNILFTKDFNGLVLKNEITGIEIIDEDDDHIYVKVGAGANWHQFILHCLDHGWAGVENLSLIPGSVGAAPIQNIGAYGVEFKDVFFELEAFEIAGNKVTIFTPNDCAFGYRDSVFKRTLKNRFVILSVTFCLNKIPRLNLTYGAIRQELARMEVEEPDIRLVSQAVINIRNSKLPDPRILGNAGSFFKNPVIDRVLFDQLKSEFPDIIGFDNQHDSVKLAAGWLIERCGWKGFRRNDAGCYEKQALVLVNYGHATGKEILDLSEEISASVFSKFGIGMEREVNVI